MIDYFSDLLLEKSWLLQYFYYFSFFTISLQLKLYSCMTANSERHPEIFFTLRK